MSLDRRFFQCIVDADDPVTSVWEELLDIWRTDTYPDDLVAFYDEREALLSHFEEGMFYGFGELYETLFQRSLSQDGKFVRELLDDKAVVVIADSFSLREVHLLEHCLEEVGYRLRIEGFAVAPFPTLTESLSRKLLGTNPSVGRDTPEFRYCYVAGPATQVRVPEGEPVLVWLRLPDIRLEEVTVAQATTVADALEVTVVALRQVLEDTGHRSVFITSDHGYIYARNNDHFWQMPPEVEREVKRTFARESRAKSGEGIHLAERYGEFFVGAGTYVAIKGRFWWAGSGQNDRCTAHGGFSLAEILVPVMLIESF